MPTATPANTWVDCGSLLAVDELAVLGDAIVTALRCRTTAADLREALAARAGCRGARRLRDALELIRVGAGSAKESELRLRIVRSGLPEPELQVDIVDERGRFVGRVDMAYPERRIAIEYEGDQHRTDPEQWDHDIRRYRTFDRLGWATFRMTRYDLATDGPLDDLRALYESRAR